MHSPCSSSAVGCGRSTGIDASVCSTSFISVRLAPATARPMGTPRPSVWSDRLVPLLPRSVGLGPVIFPPERRLGHHPIQRLPLPVDADLGIVLPQPRGPELAEDPG